MRAYVVGQLGGLRRRFEMNTLKRPWLLLVTLIALSGGALAGQKWPTAYWNVSFNGRPLSCSPVEKKRHELQAYFEARNRTKCVATDEGDHLLFSCGQTKEVVVFSREGCLGFARDEPLTEEQSQYVAAFNGCFGKAKDRIGHDTAIPYCSCMTAFIVRYSDSELAKLPRAKFEQVAQTCLSEVGGRSR